MAGVIHSFRLKQARVALDEKRDIFCRLIAARQPMMVVHPNAPLKRNSCDEVLRCGIGARGRHSIQAQIAGGERIYAIGDIHGRLDLFSDLMRRIRRDAENRRAMKTRVVLIGDIIDRGPDSAELMRRLHQFSGRRNDLVILRGNHEDVMLEALKGDLTALDSWRRFGGDATLRSWGLEEIVVSGPLGRLRDAARSVIPRAIVKWLSLLPLSFRSGNVFFVHAGIRPGFDLDEQQDEDLMWIGREFLESQDDHPAVIVHGHSIVSEGPEFHGNRIAIDTGAYRSGQLTAVGFEEDRQWVLST